MTAPDGLPFPADEAIEVQAKLDGNGTLSAHYDWTMRGDDEIALREAFHLVGPAQWTPLVQRMMNGLGFAGTVSSVTAGNPTNTESAFHYSFSYERKDYSGWANLRITPPLPPFGIEGSDQLDAPTEPFPLGAPGKVTLRASVQLPEGYSVRLPGDADLKSDVGDYTAKYSVDDQNLLTVERTMTRKKSTIAVQDWSALVEFGKEMWADEGQFIQLARFAGGTRVSRDNTQALELLQKAEESMRNRDFKAAEETLKQAEQLNPGQYGLWAAYGDLSSYQNQRPAAIEDYQKEIASHPEDVAVYPALAALQSQAKRGA